MNFNKPLPVHDDEGLEKNWLKTTLTSYQLQSYNQRFIWLTVSFSTCILYLEGPQHRPRSFVPCFLRPQYPILKYSVTTSPVTLLNCLLRPSMILLCLVDRTSFINILFWINMSFKTVPPVLVFWDNPSFDDRRNLAYLDP